MTPEQERKHLAENPGELAKMLPPHLKDYFWEAMAYARMKGKRAGFEAAREQITIPGKVYNHGNEDYKYRTPEDYLKT